MESSGLEHNPPPSYQDLATEIEDKFHFRTSATTIPRVVARVDMNWRFLLPATLWNTPSVLDAHIKYVKQILQPSFRPVIFIDGHFLYYHKKKLESRVFAEDRATPSLLPKPRQSMSWQRSVTTNIVTNLSCA
jgi:hypothetical protein